MRQKVRQFCLFDSTCFQIQHFYSMLPSLIGNGYIFHAVPHQIYIRIPLLFQAYSIVRSVCSDLQEFLSMCGYDSYSRLIHSINFFSEGFFQLVSFPGDSPNNWIFSALFHPLFSVFSIALLLILQKSSSPKECVSILFCIIICYFSFFYSCRSQNSQKSYSKLQKKCTREKGKNDSFLPLILAGCRTGLPTIQTKQPISSLRRVQFQNCFLIRIFQANIQFRDFTRNTY